MISRLFFNRNLALAALIFSIGMLFVALGSATEAAPPTPEKDESKLQLEPVEAEVVSKDMAESGLYIVQLDDAPLATYRGGVTGLRATMPSIRGEAKLDVKSADSVAYLQYLREKHNDFIASVERTLGRSINVKYRYDVAYNGMAIELSAAEASEVAKLPGVVQIAPDSLRELHTDAGPEWIGAPAIWGEDPNTEHFETELSGDNEVPPVMTNTSGTGMFTYNMMTGELHYTIENNAANVTAMHIHTGTVGVNGGVAFPLEHTTGTGTVTLTTDSQRHALMNGGYYVNVHTAAFPGGELRGQITPLHFFNAVPFEADLSGLNEVPPVTDTMASGLGTFTFDVLPRELDYLIEVSDIMSITAAHIHTGTASINGGVIHTLYNGTGNFDPDNPISGTVTLSEAEQAALWNGGLYINVHTEDNALGEIRGQIEMVGTMGENIVVGVIDTGINVDHPSFAEIGEDGYEHTNPRGEFYGECAAGGSLEGQCNDKLIGAYAYNGAPSPEDTNGHGSHTAGTAAGNFISTAVISAPTTSLTVTQLSGVAPHANIIAYNACNPCLLTGLVAAINQAATDQVDVINYSIGGGTSDPWSDQDAQAFLGARAAGVFVASSAGNSGSAAATVGSPGDAPWLLTVGSSSHNRAFTNMLQNLTGGDTAPPADIAGEGLTGSLGPSPIVYAGAIDADNPGCDVTYDPGTFSGEIVVCDYNQGPGAIPGQYNGRVNKSINLAQAGAGGFILINRVDWAAALMVDSYALPGMGIPYNDGEALKTWLASGSEHEGSIRGVESESARGDIMAGFSSRGPNVPAPDIIKPDVTAPGRRIVAAIATTDPNAPPEFDVYQGTSMSSPHAAGAAALMRAVHSNWTPSEIQSALMATALNDGVLKEDATTEADPFDMGAGRIDLTQAMNAALVLDVTTQEFQDANPADGGDPKALNLASLGNSQCVGTCSWTRTVRNTLGVTQTWNAAVVVADGVTLTGTVDPATFELAPGATQELTIAVDVSGLPEGEWFFGEVMLTPSTLVRSGAGASEVPEAHMPIAVQSSPGVLPSAIKIDTRRNAGSQLVEGIEAIEISDLTVDSMGLAQANLSEFELFEDPTNDIPSGFYDDLSQVFWMTIDVPADSYSLIADIISSESPDLDMAVGFDTDGDGEPEGSEEICQSAGGSWTEFCEILSPQAGTWWVVVLNWSESDNAPDAVTLATAVVPNSDNANMTVDGPSSQPAGETFDIRVFWDTPEMVAGDRWYGYVSLGSAPQSAGNIGTIPVYLIRHEDDVTKEVSEAVVEAGDTVTYTITVQPNVTAEDLTYSLTDSIPAGMTYVADSASATQGTVDVTDGVLTWNGTLATAVGITGNYVMSTSADDAMCDTGFGGYVNLEDSNLFPQPTISGDTATWTAFTNQDTIQFYGIDKSGISFTDDGFAFFDSTPGTSQWTNTALPDPNEPNDLMAILWNDMEIVYDGTAGSLRGVTLANAGPNISIIEYDDVEPWPAGDSDDRYDFEVVVYGAIDNTPGAYEIVFAYDNLNGLPDSVTTGLENMDGTVASEFLFGDPTGVIENGFMVCFDYQGPNFDPVVITFQATADEDAPDEVTNTVDHNTDNPGSLEASASATTSIISYGVDVSPNMTAIDVPGATVDYTLSVTNTGNMADTFDLTVDSIWTTTLSVSSVTLLAGESTTVTASVEIPSDAVADESDTATVTATSQNSGAASDLATLTTTAIPPASISLASFGQEASLAWQPIALLALLLVLMVGGGAALLQRRRTV